MLQAIARALRSPVYTDGSAFRRCRDRPLRRSAAGQQRWRPAWRPTRCCSAPSAARSGPRRRPRCGPRAGLLRLRKELGRLRQSAPGQRASRRCAMPPPLKPEMLDGVDLIFVRELTGGIYFGAKTRDAHQATDLCTYTAPEIERIVRVAARIARTPAPDAAVDRQVQCAGDLAPVARGVRARDAVRNFRTCSSSTCWWTPRRCT